MGVPGLTHPHHAEFLGPGQRMTHREPFDPQVHPVYASEDAAFRDEDEEQTLDDLQTWINNIVSETWWRERWPHVRTLVVGDGRGRSYARLGLDGSLQQPHGSRYPYISIHEAVHRVDPTGTEDHGSVFAGLYIFMVWRCYGGIRARRLAREFKKWGVVWDRVVAATGRP